MDWQTLFGLFPLFARGWEWLKVRVRGRLALELPEPVNQIGRYGTGVGFTPSWSLKIRFINRGKDPIEILDLRIIEENLGSWTIEEVFLEATGRRVQFPLRIQGAFECWIRAISPRNFQALPFEVSRLSLRVRDHTQRQGRFSVFPLTDSTTQVQK